MGTHRHFNLKNAKREGKFQRVRGLFIFAGWAEFRAALRLRKSGWLRVASLSDSLANAGSFLYKSGQMRSVRQSELFPETRWSLILRLRVRDDEEVAVPILNELCQAYWQPLYVYLRRSGQDIETAQDTVQGFLAHMLSCAGFERVSPNGGRFRYFLLGTLRNYLISEARKRGALKRGGGAQILSLDVEQAEEIFQSQRDESLSAEAAFDRQWAQTVWTRALRRLRGEQAARGRDKMFDTLKQCLTDEVGENHAAVAAQLQLSASAVSLSIHRLRRRLRELVIDELAQTVGADGDLDGELEYFLSVWSE